MKSSIFVFAAALVFLFSCNKNDSPSSSAEATMSVYLTDDPAIYDKVNIEIDSVEINDGSGWRTLNMINPGVHNLLNFRNGRDTILASSRLAQSRITQIRLILGSNNSVVVGGVSFPLQTPSAQESGLKLDVDVQLTAGVEYKAWVDFDASRSIVQTGNGTFILKPVMRVYTQAISGSLKATVLPTEADAWVYAINGSDTIASAKPDSTTGNILINGLAAGTYSLAVDGNNGYNDTTYSNVGITNGVVTDLGTIQLHQ